MSGLGFFEWHILFVGLLWLGSIPTMIYSYFKVNAWRKPLYLLAIPVAAAMAAMYINAFGQILFGWPLVVHTEHLLPITLFVLSLLFYLVPYVDRLEERTDLAAKIIAQEGTVLTIQLQQDQQLTMDAQHLVMDEQRDVMGDQRQALHDQQEGTEQDDG